MPPGLRLESMIRMQADRQSRGVRTHRKEKELVSLRESRREISPELEPYRRTSRKGFISDRAANATMQSEEAWTLEAR